MNITKISHDWHIFLGDLAAVISEAGAYLSIKIYLTSTLLINSAAWFVAYYIFSRVGQPQIALHYSVDFGIDLYGDTVKIFIIPVLGLLILLLNTAILLFLGVYNKKDLLFLSHIFMVAALLANILLLIASASIYLVNFR
jgi:hypothetical protein